MLAVKKQRGLSMRHSRTSPRPAAEAPGAAAALAQAVAQHGQRQLRLDHLDGYVAVVVHAGGIGADAVLGGVRARSADLDLHQHLPRAGLGHGLEGGDVGVAVVGGRDQVRHGLVQRAHHRVQQPVRDGDAVRDRRRVARIHHQPLRRDDGDRAVAPRAHVERRVGAAHQREHHGGVGAGQRRVGRPRHLRIAAGQVHQGLLAPDVEPHMQPDAPARSIPSSSRKSSNSYTPSGMRPMAARMPASLMSRMRAPGLHHRRRAEARREPRERRRADLEARQLRLQVAEQQVGLADVLADHRPDALVPPPALHQLHGRDRNPSWKISVALAA
jgi:hypothetical protein